MKEPTPADREMTVVHIEVKDGARWVPSEIWLSAGIARIVPPFGKPKEILGVRQPRWHFLLRKWWNLAAGGPVLCRTNDFISPVDERNGQLMIFNPLDEPLVFRLASGEEMTTGEMVRIWRGESESGRQK